MTIEEINILQDIVDIYEKEDMYPRLNHKQVRTIKKAIKVLKQEPCEDAISRQAVLDMMQMRIGGKELYKAVYDLPLVTPQPKMGRWTDNHNNTISCDRCHTWFNKDDRYGYMRYCPNCGAKMESNKNTGE